MITYLRPVPSMRRALRVCQQLLLWLFWAFSGFSDMWSNLGKGEMIFMCGSSLMRKNIVSWGRCQQVSLMSGNFVCLAFSTVLWRVRNRWPHFAAVCMRWTPVIRTHLLRTVPGLSWPPWDSSRMPTSCARWSVSSWRQSAPTWRYVRPPAGPASASEEELRTLVPFRLTGNEDCRIWPLFWILRFSFVFQGSTSVLIAK